jgi:translation elongation factor EF-1beta
MKPDHDISSTESFARWDRTPTIKNHLETGRLDSVYSFGIKDTGYKVEVTAMWYPRQQKPVWGLAVRHLDWGVHLAELEDLKVGRRAEWGDTIKTFFPKDSSSGPVDESSLGFGLENLSLDDSIIKETTAGLEFLTNKLLKLSGIVSSVSNDGGVRV